MKPIKLTQKKISSGEFHFLKDVDYLNQPVKYTFRGVDYKIMPTMFLSDDGVLSYTSKDVGRYARYDTDENRDNYVLYCKNIEKLSAKKQILEIKAQKTAAKKAMKKTMYEAIHKMSVHEDYKDFDHYYYPKIQDE